MALPVLFITAFLLGFSGAMMPGPLLTVGIHESYRRGVIAGPLLIMGHGLLESTLIIGLLLGLDAVLLRPAFQGTVALAGGLILLWMSWGMLRDSRQGRITLVLSASGRGTGMHPILAGVLVSLSNPYWMLWWATIGLTYITMAARQGKLAVLVFFSGHILADLVWYTAVSFAVVSGRKLLKQKVYEVIIFACGLFLAGLALYFILSGIKFVI